MVRLVVNGEERTVDASPGELLLSVLRERLGLTGAKSGCGEGACGACTVLIDGKAAQACTVEALSIESAAVTTVEGLAAGCYLDALQVAFVTERAFQCGYCTAGMLMAAHGLLLENPSPDEASIVQALNDNVCRCGGYPRIVKAVLRAAEATRTGERARMPADASVVEAGQAAATDGEWTFLLPAADADADAWGRRGWGWSTPGGARLTIDASGRITAFTGKVDGGQGNREGLRRLVAAELGSPTQLVRVEMGDTSTAPFDMGTFGSRSTPDAGHALRLLAAAARRELLREAALRWHVDAGGLHAEQGRVADRSGREFSFGALVTSARVLVADPDGSLGTRPDDIGSIDSDALIGDLTAVVTGKKRFPSDLSVPGMLYGRVLRAPSAGGVLDGVDASVARQMPGVRVLEEDGFVGVAASSQADAAAAVEALRPQWRMASVQPSESELAEFLRRHPVERAGWSEPVSFETGDVEQAVASADVSLSATYTTAYLAHVPLETRAALARVDADRVTVWVGTQRPFAVRWEVAAALGIPEEQVRVVVPDFGGGFGGKHTGDAAVEAARLALATGRPVKVAWSREEEFRFGYLRPAAVIDVSSSASRDGALTSWQFTNINSGDAGLLSPYRVDNQRVRFQPARSPLAQGSYRALAATANNFARESHIDELAAALSMDPIELRLRHIQDRRLTDVLTQLAEHVGSRPQRSGVGVGFACGVEKDGRVATAAEVSIAADGALHVDRVITVFDCGAIVDPDGLHAQVTGASIMALGGALFEAIHFQHGVIGNASMDSYRVPRFADIPIIEIQLRDRPDQPSAGAGETPIIAVAPAIANAITAACGTRLRALPLAPDGFVRA